MLHLTKQLVKKTPLYNLVAPYTGRTRSFGRRDLFKQQQNFTGKFETLPNTFCTVETKNIPSLDPDQSIAGWVPYHINNTKVLFWHFHSVNYGVRKPFLVRLSLIENISIVKQVHYSLPVYGIQEIDLKEVFGSNDGHSVVIEYFHPQIKKSHGGHNGHLRFWVKYFNDGHYSSTVHSFPLSNDFNFINKSLWGRTLTPFGGSKSLSCSASHWETPKEQDQRFYGYSVHLDDDQKVAGITHMAPLGIALPEGHTETQNMMFFPQIDNLDIEYTLMLREHDQKKLKAIFSVLDEESNVLSEVEKTFTSHMRVKASELFPGLNLQGKFIKIQHFSKKKNYITFHYLHNGHCLDGSHTHFCDKASTKKSNALKFMHFPKLTEDCQSRLKIINPQAGGTKNEFSFKLRVLLDNGEEFVRCYQNPGHSPIITFEIQSVFPETLDRDYQNGVLIVESFDYNLNGDFYTLSKNSQGRVFVATDHFTGG